LAVLARDDFLSPVSQAKLKLPVIATFLSGQLWTIVLLLILIGWLFEASFRSYRRELDTVADLNSRLSPKIKISVAGKGVSEDIDVNGARTKWVQFTVQGATNAPLSHCQAWLERVDRLDANSEIEFSLMEEPLRCEWSVTNDTERYSFNIPVGLQRRVNIFAVTWERPIVALVEFCKLKLQREINTSGIYRITVLVTADDAPPLRATFRFECQNYNNVYLVPD
jgi:hypothetical protein